MAMLVPQHLTKCSSKTMQVSDNVNDHLLINGCYGGNDCCSYQEHGTKCGLGEGSCSLDEECEGISKRMNQYSLT